jgi:Tol biopolymer transport system component
LAIEFRFFFNYPLLCSHRRTHMRDTKHILARDVIIVTALIVSWGLVMATNREQLRQAAQLIKQGDQKSAQTILRDVLKAATNDANAWYMNSFVSDDKTWQIKSLERALSIAPEHEQARVRLTKLGGSLPSQTVSPPAVQLAPRRSPPYVMIGALVSVIVVAIVGGALLLQTRNTTNQAEQLAAAPTASRVIVTRKPTLIPADTPTVPTATSTPTLRPTKTLTATEPVNIPTEVPLLVPATTVDTGLPSIGSIFAAPPGGEFGGGTGRILYGYQYLTEVVFQTVDLRDGTITDMPLLSEVGQAAWVSDGHQLMVSKVYPPSTCYEERDPIAAENTQVCWGFMSPDGSSFTMMSELPQVSMPALSPDRQQIAFVSRNNTDDTQVWVADITGENLRQITYGADNTPTNPVWSPDGRFILYTSGERITDDIHRVTRDGMEDQVIIQRGLMPSWSPDGRSLVYVGYAGRDEQIFIAEADGTNPRQITSDTKDPQWPVWSPDGQFIAFVSDDGLFVMNADGSDLKNLADYYDYMRKPSWQPLPFTASVTATPTPLPSATIPTATPLSRSEVGGGTGRILYQQSQIARLDAVFQQFDLRDGTTSTLRMPESVTWAEWGSDGRRLLVTKDLGPNPCIGDLNVTSGTPSVHCVGFVDSETSALSLLPNIPNSRGLSLSPDMSRMAFIQPDEDNDLQIWVSHLDGTNLQQVTHAPTSIQSNDLQWRPDGRFISYTYGGKIHLIAVESSEDRVLIEEGAFGVWSPDGTTIAYTVNVPIEDSVTQTYIYTADAQGQHIRQITFKEGPIHYDSQPAWSPDGQFIAFLRNDKMLYVMRVDGTVARLIVEAPPDMHLENPSWQPMPVSALDATSTPFPTLTAVPPVTAVTHVPVTRAPTITPSPTPTVTPSITSTPFATVNPSKAFTAVSGRGSAVAELYKSQDEFLARGQGDAATNFTLEGGSFIEVENGEVKIAVGVNGETWNFWFYAPNLEVGRTFTDVERFYRSNPGLPGMDISSPGSGCNEVSGEFTIEQAEPEVIVRFTHFCEGKPEWELSGTITFRPE